MQEKKTILFVEDDQALATSLCLVFKLEGFEVALADHIERARVLLKTRKVDLVLLDLHLPDGNGSDFCKYVRLHLPEACILMLTARTEEESALDAFAAGANDYIRKPIGNKELLFRIRQWLSIRHPTIDEAVTYFDLSLNTKTRIATYKSKTLDLRRKEFDILFHLTKHGGEVVSRNQILDLINSSREIVDRTVDSHMSHIRLKLKEVMAEVTIAPVYGVGYRLHRT